MYSFLTTKKAVIVQFLLCLFILPLNLFANEGHSHIEEYNSLLPPLIEWHGKSEALIQPNSNPWQTDSEKSGLTTSPDYLNTTRYIQKLVASDNRLNMVSLGKSPQGRDIWMVIATKEGINDPDSLHKLNKPTLLVQAGIHSGEIDGKDAGLMLLRDIIHGNKSQLIDNVNLLFVPILSVDAHERRENHNRVNQRGPLKMGWRSNARNLNLNRDYTKLDTEELQHLIKAINIWKPDLYYDVHVTDGEDYQYDITYGFNLPYGESPNIANWLSTYLKPQVNTALKENGHKGGPLTFGIDPMEFSKGIIGWSPSPRFSNGYGDYRHLATVLLENHSLKPYKQRVLGTYVFIEQTLKLLAKKGAELIKATKLDSNKRPNEMVVDWQLNNEQLEKIDFEGIAYRREKDELTQLNYIKWLGIPKRYKNLPLMIMNKVKQKVPVAKSYWIPPQYKEVIKRLKWHGIKVIKHASEKNLKLTQLNAVKYKIKETPFEGRQMVSSTFNAKIKTINIAKNSIEVSTNQPLGALAVALLDPRAPDSFFAWGFFNTIFQRTEYIESYALIPLAKQLFTQYPLLKHQFEALKNNDDKFLNDQKKQMEWIYRQSKYYDKNYLVYPILMDY